MDSPFFYRQIASQSLVPASGTTFLKSASTQRTYLILLMSLRNQQSMCDRDYRVGGNNLFSSIRWYGVAARCVRLTTSLRSASSKFAFPSCYLKVFSDFSLYIHEFWLVRQNNADIICFHPSAPCLNKLVNRVLNNSFRVGASRWDGVGAKPEKMRQACIKDPRHPTKTCEEACLIFLTATSSPIYFCTTPSDEGC